MTIMTALGARTRGALIGAGAGAGVGWLSGDGLFPGGSMLGGAVGGAFAGGVGLPLARGLLRGRTLAGTGQAGLGLGIGYGGRAAALAADRGGRAGFVASNLMGRGISGMFTARAWLRRNAAVTNKYGGKALAGLGMASAGYLGASAMSSNRGY